MPQVTRANGSTYFETLSGTANIDPDVGAAIDDELNAIIAAYNAIDNANVADTPKIAGSKVDLTSAGFLPLTGGSLSALLTHNFDGIFRLMRATGNGRIREYRGSDGALWGISYNTEWVSGAWTGRDITDVCAALKMESDGLHYYHAVSGSAGSTPSFTEVFHVDTSGIFQVGNVKDGAITPREIGTYVAGGSGGGSFTNATARYTAAASYIKLKETTWLGGPAQLRIAFDLDCDAAITIYAKIYRNGVAVGTQRTTSDGVLTNFSEDISGWVYGDLVQVYGYTTDAGWPVIVSNLVISAGFTYGESTAGY